MKKKVHPTRRKTVEFPLVLVDKAERLIERERAAGRKSDFSKVNCEALAFFLEKNV